MDDFVKTLGVAFLPHVLRRVSDEIVSGEEDWNIASGFVIPPRACSTLMLLHKEGPKGVTEVANALCQSHQLVMVWIKQLSELGLVSSSNDPDDARRRIICLTKKGAAQIHLLNDILRADEQAMASLMDEADAHIWEALWRLHEALRRKPYAERLSEQMTTASA